MARLNAIFETLTWSYSKRQEKEAFSKLETSKVCEVISKL